MKNDTPFLHHIHLNFDVQLYSTKTFHQSLSISKNTTSTLTKCLEKKLDGNNTWMLHVVLNRSCIQHPTKQQLYSHLGPISQIIQVRQTRHTRHCWNSKGELVSDIILWTLTHGHTSDCCLAKTYIHQICADSGCRLDN